MGEVVTLNTQTTLDIPVSKVLEGAQDLESVVLVGLTKDGEIYFASSGGDGPSINWLLDHAKLRLLSDDGE